MGLLKDSNARCSPAAKKRFVRCSDELDFVVYHNRVKKGGMQTAEVCNLKVRQKTDRFLLFPDEVVIYSLH